MVYVMVMESHATLEDALEQKYLSQAGVASTLLDY